MTKVCAYCTKSYSKDSEHVFPDGLGGEDIFLDCVCKKCNNEFSKMERELYQKSFIGMMRSVEGLTKRKNTRRSTPFKAQTILALDRKNEIAYEVIQERDMRISLRPQIIEVRSNFYIEGDSEENIEIFKKRINEWGEFNFAILKNAPLLKGGPFSVLHFKNIMGQFEVSDEMITKGNSKDIVVAVNILPETDELYDYLVPRIFLNDDRVICMRAKSLDSAVDFMLKFLNFSKIKVPINSYRDKSLENPEVYVRFSFNNEYCMRAIVKIILNSIMHHFPQTKYSIGLKDLISYVREGKPQPKISLEPKHNLWDSIENSHNISFMQMDFGLHVRLSFFNGRAAFSVNIPSFKILNNGTYYRLVIDYKNRKNRFEDYELFIKSFSSPLSNKS